MTSVITPYQHLALILPRRAAISLRYSLMTSNMLCSWCSTVPLGHKLLNQAEGQIYNLGSLARLQDNQCPFCRLTFTAISTQDEDLSTGNVVLRWRTSLGAFMIVGVLGVWICFAPTVADRARSGDPHLEGLPSPSRFIIQRLTGPTLDTTGVLRWVSSCQQGHGLMCELPTSSNFAATFRGLDFLRLIDVQSFCIIETRTLERYIALSYVWGNVSNFRLTKANKLALQIPGSLNTVFPLLPRTIQDSISLARSLKCRYLWVDALCLLQNDAEDLDRGVNAMDQIYEHAWLTVVAGTGYDANARLLGVGHGTRQISRNLIEVKPGVEMGIVTVLDNLLKRSAYNSRAWT